MSMLKPLFYPYIKASLYIRKVYTDTLVEIMTDMAQAERDRIEAQREADYQERQARYREEQAKSSSQV